VANCKDASRVETVAQEVETIFHDAMDQDYENEAGIENNKPLLDFDIVNKVLKKTSRAKVQGLNEVELKKIIKSQYGLDWESHEGERMRYAVYLDSLLRSNPGVAKWFVKYATKDIVHSVNAVDLANSASLGAIEWEDNAHGDRVPVFRTIPLNKLKHLYTEAYNWAYPKDGFNIRKGWIGRMQLGLLTPKRVEMRDSSGSIAAVREATEDWYSMAQAYGDEFKNHPDHGTVRLAEDLKVLQARMKIDNKRVMDYIYSGILMGELYISKTGQLMQNKKLIKRDPHSEFASFEWVEPTVFIYKNKKDQDTQVHFLKKSKPGEVSEYDTINDIVNRYRALSQSILNRVSSDGKKLNKEYLEVKKSLEGVEVDGVDLQEMMGDLFGEMYDENINIAGINVFHRRDKYFPTMYLQAKIFRLMENAKNEMEESISRKQAERKIEEDHERAHHLFQDVLDLQLGVAAIEDKLDMRSNQANSWNIKTGQPTNTRKFYKNFRNISYAIPFHERRRDGAVMNDYIDSLANTTMQNLVTVRTMKAVADAIKKKGNPEAINYAVDLYKRTFYMPDAISTVMGVNVSAERSSEAARKAGFSVSPEDVIHWGKMFSSYTTFTLLSDLSQGYINYTANILKITDIGRERYERALKDYDDNPEFWDKEAEKRKVTSFTNFVETWLASELSVDEQKAYEKEIKIFKKLLKNNNDGLTISDKDMKRYKAQLKLLKRSHARAAMDSLAQWAITRRDFYYDNAPLFVKMVGKAVHTTGIKQMIKLVPTIDQTERKLRTISYIIGVQNSVESGYADSITDKRAGEMGVAYTMRTDFGLTHQSAGREMAGPIAGGVVNKMKIWYSQNFGETIRMHLNAMRGFSEVADSHGKIKNRSGVTPVGMVKYLNNLLNLKGSIPAAVAGGMVTGGLGGSVIGGMLGIAAMQTPKNQKLKNVRIVNPDMAKAKSHFFIYGLTTLLMDHVIFGSFATAGLTSILRRGAYRSGTRKIGSGLVNPVYSIAFGLSKLAFNLWNASNRAEDADDWDEWISKYLYHSHMGIGGAMMTSMLLNVLVDMDEAKKRGEFSYKKDHKRRWAIPITTRIGYELGDAVTDYFRKLLR
jgi:hypothetical protein